MQDGAARLDDALQAATMFLDKTKNIVCICQGSAIRWINPFGLALMRFNTMADATGRKITDFIGDDFAEVFADGLDLVADEAQGLPLRMITIDGHALDVVFHATRLGNDVFPGEEEPVFLIECRDVSDQTKMFREARWRERRLNTILKTVDLAVISINSFGIIESANDAAATMFGYPLTALVGHNVGMLMPEPHASQHDEYILRYHATGTKTVLERTRELDARRADGTLFPIELTVTQQIETASTSIFVGIIRDVTVIKAQQERIHFLAMNDSLTGLPNRAYFNERLQETLARRHADSGSFAVLFIDLDHFKPINDTYGHEAGDTVLRTVAERLNGVVRSDDMVARLGGDEFVIILESAPDRQTVARVAERILTDLAQPISLGTERCTVGASIGIGCFPDDADSVDTLLSVSDHAMYATKKAGRNGYSFPPRPEGQACD